MVSMEKYLLFASMVYCLVTFQLLWPNRKFSSWDGKTMPAQAQGQPRHIEKNCRLLGLLGMMLFYVISRGLNFHDAYYTYLNGHLLGAPRENVTHGLCPGIDCASCWVSFPKYIFVYSGPPFILLFAPTAHVSHLTPSLLIGSLALVYK
jgi:hypothetical protein